MPMEERTSKQTDFYTLQGTYRKNDLIERYLTRPSVLRAFDWRVAMVLTKDWYHNPDDMLRRLERALNGTQVSETSDSDPAPPVEHDEAVTPKDEEDIKELDEPPVGVAERSGSVPSTSSGRYFEFIGGSSRKFWEVTAEDCQVYVRFGRIGSKGQIQLKRFDSVAAAHDEVRKLIGEKTRKGYVERGLPRRE